MLNISIIIGSTRESRFSEKPAHWIFELTKQLPDVAVELIDLRDFPLPFLADAELPSARKGPHPNPVVNALGEKIAKSDAFIIVTPEYNHGYPAVLKNALDHYYSEWNNKPIGFVSHGGVAGARSVEQLRLVAIELQMAPIRNAIHIPQFWTRTDDTGQFKGDDLKDTADRFLTQLLWWTKALSTARKNQ